MKGKKALPDSNFQHLNLLCGTRLLKICRKYGILPFSRDVLWKNSEAKTAVQDIYLYINQLVYFV